MLYYHETDNGRSTRVRVLVSKNLKNIVIKATSFFDRVAMLTIKLYNPFNAEIVQVFAPTSTCEYQDQVIEKFYEDFLKVLGKTRRLNLRIIMEHFSARIDTKHSNVYVVGAFGNRTRDERGHRLIEFADCEKFYVMNSFFKGTQGKNGPGEVPMEELVKLSTF